MENNYTERIRLLKVMEELQTKLQLLHCENANFREVLETIVNNKKSKKDIVTLCKNALTWKP